MKSISEAKAWLEGLFSPEQAYCCLVRCLNPGEARPTAMELLEDPFFAKPRLPPPEVARRPSGGPQMEPEDPHHRGGPNHQHHQDGGASSEGDEACEVGMPLCY